MTRAPVAASASFNVLKKRAVSCSFSSIYHLPHSGIDKKTFTIIRRTFNCFVALPIVIIASSFAFNKLKQQ